MHGRPSEPPPLILVVLVVLVVSGRPPALLRGSPPQNRTCTFRRIRLKQVPRTVRKGAPGGHADCQLRGDCGGSRRG
ncbi:hypothetical protein [Actinophytocola sp. NPDC049390]|uniref:hypothetical protein n=1 Tax=Actinophytocola sp. NPDC049390 TaxID=3363894 RepID=UPI00378EAAFB